MPNLCALPAAFSKGRTVNYAKSDPDYPPSAGWTFTLYLAGVAEFSRAATTSGESYVVTPTAAETAPSGLASTSVPSGSRKTPDVCDVASGQVRVTRTW